MFYDNADVIRLTVHKHHLTFKGLDNGDVIRLTVHKHHLTFKGLMQLNYNVLVFTHFYAMVIFQFAE